MVGDGTMGTQLQAADLTLDDFLDLEGVRRDPSRRHRDHPPQLFRGGR
jgi:methionine synthase I (cobalamin-dependent)